MARVNAEHFLNGFRHHTFFPQSDARLMYVRELDAGGFEGGAYLCNGGPLSRRSAFAIGGLFLVRLRLACGGEPARACPEKGSVPSGRGLGSMVATTWEAEQPRDSKSIRKQT
jgi:hypothetical protein